MSQERHSDVAVVISDITAGYERDRPVFRGFSSEFAAHGLTHVAGPNGSGKSTLVELVSGYLRPWAGAVTVHGIDASSPDARARRRVCRAQPPCSRA
jgi:ABC-type multidrug transport system ATPase subunit